MTEFLGYGIVAVIIAVLLFYAVVALLPSGLALKPERDEVPTGLPSNRLVNREDLLAVRLPVVLRGYRMADTDDLLDRLTLEIAVRDRELERLRAAHPEPDSANEADVPGPEPRSEWARPETGPLPTGPQSDTEAP